MDAAATSRTNSLATQDLYHDVVFGALRKIFVVIAPICSRPELPTATARPTTATRASPLPLSRAVSGVLLKAHQVFARTPTTPRSSITTTNATAKPTTALAAPSLVLDAVFALEVPIVAQRRGI